MGVMTYNDGVINQDDWKHRQACSVANMHSLGAELVAKMHKIILSDVQMLCKLTFLCEIVSKSDGKLFYPRRLEIRKNSSQAQIGILRHRIRNVIPLVVEAILGIKGCMQHDMMASPTLS